MNLLINREAHVFIVNLGIYTDISISIHRKNTSWYLGIYKDISIIYRVSQKKRTFRIIILQADTSERPPEPTSHACGLGWIVGLQ